MLVEFDVWACECGGVEEDLWHHKHILKVKGKCRRQPYHVWDDGIGHLPSTHSTCADKLTACHSSAPHFDTYNERDLLK